MTLSRVPRSVLFLAAIAAVYLLFLLVHLGAAHAAPAEAAPAAAGIDWTVVLLGIIAVLSAIRTVLQFTASRTRTPIDDWALAVINAALGVLRGPRPVDPGPVAPMPPQAGRVGAGMLLALAVLGIVACATVKPLAVETKTAVVDCVKADKQPIIALLAELAGDAVTAALGGAVDWPALAGKAWSQGREVGGCAFVALVSGQPRSTARTLTGAPAASPADLALEQLRTRFGGVQWRTEAGVR